MTIELPLTTDYVREHPNEWTVKVSKQANNQIQFTITRKLSEPKYLVAHFAVSHHGKVIATSDSTAFGRKRDNTFYFSLAPEDLAESKFELSESYFTESGGEAIPMVGSIIHQFRLLDFVPAALLKPAPQK